MCPVIFGIEAGGQSDQVQASITHEIHIQTGLVGKYCTVLETYGKRSCEVFVERRDLAISCVMLELLCSRNISL